MTASAYIPEVQIDSFLADWIRARCASSNALVELEKAALSDQFDAPFFSSPPWLDCKMKALALWRANDHVIIRGLPVEGDGASALFAAYMFGRNFKSYRNDKIIKHFRVSPWTKDLSHTLEEGHFHTDVNTTPVPPSVTGIQCKTPDPGAPNYGELRVARLPDLMCSLEQSGKFKTLDFLCAVDVTMVNESSPVGWTGRIVADGCIRYHPETLRAARRRYGNLPADIEEHLSTIREAALNVSTPIHLDAGDILIVSNKRALHYRGACSVVFHSFPRVFSTREVYVLHVLDESS